MGSFDSYRVAGGPGVADVLRVQAKWIEQANNSPEFFEDLARAEKGFAQDYIGRFAIEMIQNAADAAGKGGRADGRVLFEFVKGDPGIGSLLVANDGAPFGVSELEAICRIGRSSKPPGTAIGHKGLGFKSVLEIADEPWVFSGPFAFHFSRTETIAALAAAMPGSSLAAGSVQALRIPFAASVEALPSAESAALRRLLDDEGYATVVRLPLRGIDEVSTVATRLKELDSRTILFLESLATIAIRGTGHDRVVVRRQANDLAVLSIDGVDASHWLVCSSIVDPPRELLESLRDETWLEVEHVRCAVALPVGSDGRPAANAAERVFIHLPTEATTGFPFVLHGDFFPDPSRKGALDCPFNDWMADRAADLVVQSALPSATTRWQDEPAVTRLFIPLEQATPGVGERLRATLAARLRGHRFVATQQNGFLRPDEVRLGPRGARPKIVRTLVSELDAGECSPVVHADLDLDQTVRPWLSNAGALELPAELVLRAVRRVLERGSPGAPVLAFLASWESSVTGEYREALRRLLRSERWIPCVGGWLASSEEKVFFQRERDDVPPPPAFLPVHLVEPSAAPAGELDVRALLTLAGVRDFSFRDILQRVVLPAASIHGEILAEDRLFNIYKYLRAYRRVSRGADEVIDSLAARVQVPCARGAGGFVERRAAAEVYFSSAWTGSSDLESAFTGLDGVWFLDPLVSLVGDTQDERAQWCDFFSWLGVANCPRRIVAPSGSVQRLHLDNNHPLHSAWGYAGWLTSLGGAVRCAEGHDGYEQQLEFPVVLDHFADLLSLGDSERLMAYFRSLAANWPKYESMATARIRCRHGWHGSAGVRIVESYLSWALRNAPWIPSVRQQRLPQPMPACEIWSVRELFVRRAVKAFVPALASALDTPETASLRSFLRFAEPSSASLREWMGLLESVHVQIPPDSLADPTLADQARSVVRWAAKYIDDVLRRGMTEPPGMGVMLPANTQRGVEYVSSRVAFYSDDPELRARWADACAYVDIDDDVPRARRFLGIRDLRSTVVTDVTPEVPLPDATLDATRRVSELFPAFLAIIHTVRPSAVDEIVPRMRRLQLAVSSRVRLVERLEGVAAEPRHVDVRLHLQRVVTELSGAARAVEGTLHVAEPIETALDEVAEAVARYVEMSFLGDTLAVLLSATPDRRASLLRRRGATEPIVEEMRARLDLEDFGEDPLVTALAARVTAEVNGIEVLEESAPVAVMPPEYPVSLTFVPPMASPLSESSATTFTGMEAGVLPPLDIDGLECRDIVPAGPAAAPSRDDRRGGSGGPSYGAIDWGGGDAANRRDGRRGEQTVFEYERKRLRSAGRPDLAAAVIWRADNSPYADHDVESFELDGTPIIIEVKATASEQLGECSLSPAEFRCARRWRERYFLYRVTRVREARPGIDRIQDPYRLVREERLGFDVGNVVLYFGG